jgi:cytochrome c biogenesis protein CcmG, thiol:disulfide interchange protein DsbE
VSPGRRGVLASLVAFLTLLVTLASGQSAGVLQALSLGGYPADTRPPGFSAATVDGPALSLESLRSRVVLLNVWATWCLECRAELPVLEALHRDYATRGLTVLALNFGEEPGTVRQYARELGLTMPLLLDPTGAVRKSYGVIGLPTSFLIGRDGRAVARAIGPREWGSAEARALIESLLMEAIERR